MGTTIENRNAVSSFNSIYTCNKCNHSLARDYTTTGCSRYSASNHSMVMDTIEVGEI